MSIKMLNKAVASLKHKLQKEEGLSVIELMIGTVILITVSAVVASIIVTTSNQVSKTSEDAYYKNQLTLAGKIIAKTTSQAISLISSTATGIELETDSGGRVEIFTTQPNCGVSARTYDSANNIINTIQIIESLDNCAIFTIDNPIITANLSYTTISGTYNFTIDSAAGNLKETKDSGILDETLEGILFYTASFNNGQPYTFKLNQSNEQTPVIQVSGSAPFTYSLHSGVLPDAITFNETTGRLIGPATWNLLVAENNFEKSLTIKIEDSTGIQILLPIVIKSPKFIPIQATGGIINDYTENGITYRIHTFISVGTTPFSVTSTGNGNAQVEYLIIAGGGGGGGSGNAGGAGGGAGGGVITNFYSTGFTVNTGNYDITVGAGGHGGAASNNRGLSGSNSSAFNLLASGGGGGGGTNQTGNPGGSGGGGGGTSTTTIPLGGAGILGQGNNGGDGAGTNSLGQRAGAGGGGAGVTGSNALPGQGGDGGNGTPITINGDTTYYAAGGGGGVAIGVDRIAAGFGGLGGGGDGNTGAGFSAVQNTGSGGGGAGSYSASGSSSGGAGGSGIVIIRYIISGSG